MNERFVPYNAASMREVTPARWWSRAVLSAADRALMATGGTAVREVLARPSGARRRRRILLVILWKGGSGHEPLEGALSGGSRTGALEPGSESPKIETGGDEEVFELHLGEAPRAGPSCSR